MRQFVNCNLLICSASSCVYCLGILRWTTFTRSVKLEQKSTGTKQGYLIYEFWLDTNPTNEQSGKDSNIIGKRSSGPSRTIWFYQKQVLFIQTCCLRLKTARDLRITRSDLTFWKLIRLKSNSIIPKWVTVGNSYVTMTRSRLFGGRCMMNCGFWDWLSTHLLL